MPLLIEIKSGDKIIINGAVLENAGSSSKLLVHNQASILRGKEILSEEESNTPASRTYFALQCAYMFADKKDEYLKLFNNFLTEYTVACPSAEPIAGEIRDEVEQGKLYKGLKAAQKLINHERELLQSLQVDVEQASGDTP